MCEEINTQGIEFNTTLLLKRNMNTSVHRHLGLLWLQGEQIVYRLLYLFP